MPERCCLLQPFIMEHRSRLDAWISETSKEQILTSQQKFLSTFNLRLFALALAQHYGMPSSGLDVTDRIDIALFLH